MAAAAKYVTSYQFTDFKDEMREFKDEMREFKDEMREFREEMRDQFALQAAQFRDELDSNLTIHRTSIVTEIKGYIEHKLVAQSSELKAYTDSRVAELKAYTDEVVSDSAAEILDAIAIWKPST